VNFEADFLAKMRLSRTEWESYACLEKQRRRGIVVEVTAKDAGVQAELPRKDLVMPLVILARATGRERSTTGFTESSCGELARKDFPSRRFGRLDRRRRAQRLAKNKP